MCPFYDEDEDEPEPEPSSVVVSVDMVASVAKVYSDECGSSAEPGSWTG